ncbi:hypothetical protein F5882DRAFT_508141 [Hyaloscypha sp. PMI_1271]|nr:hypothetical protein F5882DRAFT_508141 [Hyaloscypha sp. PMI_1271]
METLILAVPPKTLALSNALLKLEDSGEFSLTKRITHPTTPTTPYAILSHTWGEDDEEVNFGDLKDSSRKTKVGYKKLRFLWRVGRSRWPTILLGGHLLQVK